MSYGADRLWADTYVAELCHLIGPYLLRPSTLEQDIKEATDLVLLRARDLNIACRIRRPGYAEQYPRQFTIRSRRDSGTMTEYEKIRDGWGDWFFYGHARPCFPTIHPWYLIDLNAFRSHLIRTASRNVIEWGQKSNGDGTHFLWFGIDSFPKPPPLLIGESNDRDHPWILEP
jgi:hypothetical protein